MKKNIIYLFSCLMLSVAFPGCANTNKETKSAKTDRQIPLKDFFRNPEVQAFRISPDGKKIAVLKPYKNRMNVFIADFGKQNWKRMTSYTDRGVQMGGWKGNETVLFTRDFGGNENFHVFSVNSKTNEVKDLTPGEKVKASVADLLTDLSETNIYVSTNKRNESIFDIYDVNIITGESKMILENPGKQTDWVIDHKGQIRLASETDGVNYTFYHRDDNTKEFKKVKAFGFKESFAPQFFDSENKNVYVLTNVGSDKSELMLMDPKTFKVIKNVYANPNYDLNWVTYSKKNKDLVSVNYVDWKEQQHFFDKKYQEMYAFIQSKLPDKEISLTSHNKDETVFTVYAGSDRSKGTYYTYDSEKKDLVFLMDMSPWIQAARMAEMKPIKYKSRDGLTIEGYLTLPPGKETAKNLPLIVNPHGGPWHRDVWGFNPEVQFLASRGYAVLQMNFRGSTGYGKKFWQSSFKQWGLKMQDDITDGVNWAANEGIADKNKVCIYGASYGGYATLAGLTFTPDVYKCGVDYVGVSNLFTFQETIPPYWAPMKDMLYEMVGHPIKDKALLEKSSPVFHVDKIKAALFVAQGANDPRVKKSESDQIVAALKAKGIDVPYMVKDNEGHGFHNQENQFEFYGKMEAFLDKHLNN